MPAPIGPMPSGVYYHDSCARCVSADNCFDTDVQNEYWGALALCRGCIGDLAVAAGFDIADTQLREALASYEAAERSAEKAKATLARVRAAIR